MFIKTVTYTDYNGNKRTEDFLFHLNKAEALEMELSVNGGLSERMKKLSAKQDTKELVQIIKNMIVKSYGEKTEDGRRFMKSEELTRSFMETEAYSQIFIECCTNPKAAANFINCIMPADIAEQAKKSLIEEAKSNANVKALLSAINSSDTTE